MAKTIFIDGRKISSVMTAALFFRLPGVTGYRFQPSVIIKFGTVRSDQGRQRAMLNMTSWRISAVSVLSKLTAWWGFRLHALLFRLRAPGFIQIPRQFLKGEKWL